MSNPFSNGVPEPSWLKYGPDDPDVPDNYLDPEARRALLELAESWLDPVDINTLMHKVLSEDPITKHADALRERYEEWLTLTKAFGDTAMAVYDETVGDDWRDE